MNKKVTELNKEELQELKVKYLDNYLMENEDRNISYDEMASIDEYVSDEEIFDEYRDYSFTEEDFDYNEEKFEDNQVKESINDIIKRNTKENHVEKSEKKKDLEER